MYLLAVSGGPDSMFLLSQHKRKKIVVATINYYTRKTSTEDVKVVEDYCKNNNIPFEKTDAHFPEKGNFENWARDFRYNFFKKIYQKYDCKKLLLAHHKDDFIETALMQQRSGRNPKYFGIRKKTERHGMQIYRPFISLYWKDKILLYLKNDKTPFAIDETNLDPEYSTRNAIRHEMLSWTSKKKNSVYGWFKMSNKILKKKNKRIQQRYLKWQEKEFSINHFKLIDKYQVEIVHEFITHNYDNIKLSTEKMKSIISFIKAQNGKAIFKLNQHYDLKKTSGKLVATKTHL